MKRIKKIPIRSAIQKSELKKLFHIDDSLKRRTIPLISVLDEEKNLHSWLPKGDKLIKIRFSDIVEGEYFAKERLSNDDVLLNFINFIFQKFYNGETASIMIALISDIRNMATCLKKIRLYHNIRNDKNISVQRFVSSEIEYFVGISRCVYDLFQLVVNVIWDSIKLFDSKANKQQLKDSFADMVLKNNNPISAQEIQEKYGLPPNCAKFYEKETPFFKVIKDYRDNVQHFGLTPENTIFPTDYGFAIPSNYKPFATFDIWKEEMFLKDNPNKLIPLLPALAYVIKETIGMMDRFLDSISKNFIFPKDIAPGYYVFLRGKHINELNKLDEYINKNYWYES